MFFPPSVGGLTILRSSWGPSHVPIWSHLNTIWIDKHWSIKQLIACCRLIFGMVSAACFCFVGLQPHHAPCKVEEMMSSLESEAAICEMSGTRAVLSPNLRPSFCSKNHPLCTLILTLPHMEVHGHTGCALYSTLLEICLHLLVDTAPIKHPFPFIVN